MTGRRIDGAFATGAVALYFIAAILLLPQTEYLRALGLGMAVYLSLAFLAIRLGPAPLAGFDVLAVTFASAAVLFMPTFPAMGGDSATAVPVGAGGTQAAVILWAALRWPGGPARSGPRTSLPEAFTFAGLMALGISVIATIPIALGAFSHQPRWTSVLWVYPAYFAGAALAALCYWLLQGIAHLATGRYLLGVLCGTCVYAAVAPVVAVLDAEAFHLGESLMIGYACGSIVGPAVALSWDAAT